MRKKYDVIIVGAGPAGIFCAVEMVTGNNLKILILERGKDISKRKCPVRGTTKNCIHCTPCDLLCGWGGAGAFSDGKLTLSTDVGGNLTKFVSESIARELIKTADDLYLKFGAPTEVFGADEDDIKELQKKASLANLILIPYHLRHLGTEKCIEILRAIEEHLHDRVDIQTESEVEKILVKDGRATGVKLKDGTTFQGNYIVVAPGRHGSEWLTSEATRLKLDTFINPVDIGLRVEVPATVAEPITHGVYESKFIYYSKSFDDKIRTFCMCPYGEVASEYSDGIVTVNGHSYKDKKTDNTNFALLVSKTFTHPFKDPIAYGQYIARLANILSGGVMVQRLGDLQLGRRSTRERIKKSLVKPTLKGATPGDLSLVFPYRHLSSLLEMLDALDMVAPGINSRHTLLYGVEVKFYSTRWVVDSNLETKIGNLFVAGDGAGITRGLIQASASGILVAREIKKRES
ncbi:MAG: NAD(P)/FAD-dependent oxidoreductase [Candidatus Eremiobacteraeota bacterium]|nr:NAD(P)/FAD-dependent oxidoreductase [Candidatus Eremiobacteraeota bacterium]